MAVIRAVIFDLDDTLYDCSGRLVESARRRAAAAMVCAGLPCTEEEAYKVQAELEHEFGPKFDVFERIAERYSCPTSIADVALAAYNSDEVEEIHPFPGVRKVLAELRSEGCRLFLVTTGIYTRQLRKVQLLGLADAFDELVINDADKGLPLSECYKQLAAKYHLAPEEIAVIGDRIYAEIKVGNILGMNTIQFIHGRFKHLSAKTDIEIPDYRIKDISELPRALHVIGKKRAASGLRIVAVGGGTGLPMVLNGLKKHTGNLTAIVTVTDSGRSSGMIRNDLGVLPPGDIRNCLVALSGSERLLHELFQYRFDNGMLEGMSLGNLFIAGLAKVTGSFEQALQHAGEILAIQGCVLPSTFSDVHICARTTDGNVYEQEFNVRTPGKQPIDEVYLDNPDVPGSAQAIEEILQADIVVLGPGSLFTSVISNLLVKDIAAAIRHTKAKSLYVCNIVTQPGQTDGFDAADHVRAIFKYIGDGGVDYVLLNDNIPSDEILQRYADEGAELVVPGDVDGLGVQIIRADLVEDIQNKRALWEKQDLLRHDPAKLADAIIKLCDRHPANE
ncbi:MAG: uridine diphosphate-N-acetylglucosamine-binding protein YvcK [Planctomycetes bacterium]|nr:uridine diphosphate-N-acetylglucosamine-binding protein YvcK [Planctomycetota bacterium]